MIGSVGWTADAFVLYTLLFPGSGSESGSGLGCPLEYFLMRLSLWMGCWISRDESGSGMPGYIYH